MKYYFDTEFLEGPQKKSILGIKYGETKPTIDFISIGIVDENNREYYAISKEFNLDEAWNRWQSNGYQMINTGMDKKPIKEYWIRQHVLLPIFNELLESARAEEYKANMVTCSILSISKLSKFSKKNMKFLIKRYGKSNNEIADEIKYFVNAPTLCKTKYEHKESITNNPVIPINKFNPQFYAYYADYDWVVFCWLFGTMMNLPKEFPMYCIDLMQEFDLKANSMSTMDITNAVYGKGTMSHDVFKDADDKYLEFDVTKINCLKDSKDYPTQENEHNALEDAKWNKKLHEFIQQL